MTLLGWCTGPVGSRADHDACPHEIGAGDRILTCSCDCHKTPALEGDA